MLKVETLRGDVDQDQENGDRRARGWDSGVGCCLKQEGPGRPPGEGASLQGMQERGLGWLQEERPWV